MHILQNLTLSRRHTLKGLGVSLGLPWLEIMAGDNKEVMKTPRMAFILMPNGVNEHHWTPEGEGKEFKLSKTLSPLSIHKNNSLILTNLMNAQSKHGDGHYAKVANWLSGALVHKSTGAGMKVGTSIDQLAAQKKGHLTPLPSLELSLQEPSTSVDNNVGFTALYGGHISWSSPTTPVARETIPRLSYDRLFSRRRNLQDTRSVLDLVHQDLKEMIKQVGQSDKHKLDEYMTSLRALEKRIEFNEKEDERVDEKWIKKNRPKAGKPTDLNEHIELMYKIISLAFQTDRTRIASFMLGRAVSGLNYSFLGHGITSNHHQISHHAGDKEKLDQYQKINEYHIKKLSEFLSSLKNIPEGNGNVLDQTMVLFGSGQRDGNKHSPINLPIVLAGGSKLGIQQGQHLMYEEETPLCKLYISMLNAFGISTNSFGDGQGELKGIRV